MSQTDQTNASVTERAVQVFQWAVLGTLATLGQTLVGETLVRLALRFDFWFGLAIGIVLVLSVLALRSESRHEQLPDATGDERNGSTEDSEYPWPTDDDTEFAAEDVAWSDSPQSNEADSATDPSPSTSRPQSESESDTDAEPESPSQGRQQPSKGGQPQGGRPQGGQQPPQGGQPQGGQPAGRPRYGSASTASTPSTRRERLRSFVGRQRDAFVRWFRGGRWYHYLIFLSAVGGSVMLDRTYGVSAVLLASVVLVVGLSFVEGSRRVSSRGG